MKTMECKALDTAGNIAKNTNLICILLRAIVSSSYMSTPQFIGTSSFQDKNS